eukprot:gene240-113_t
MEAGTAGNEGSGSFVATAHTIPDAKGPAEKPAANSAENELSDVSDVMVAAGKAAGASPDAESSAAKAAGAPRSSSRTSLGIPSTPADKEAAAAKKELAKLLRRCEGADIARGCAMFFMLFVDMVGEAYPSIGHAPWNGVHLADFVMPLFLFVVGFAIPLSIGKSYGARVVGVWGAAQGASGGMTMREKRHKMMAIVKRALKLFLIGFLVQGSWFFSMNVSNARVMGILQRIAIVYGFLAALEVAGTPTKTEASAFATERLSRVQLVQLVPDSGGAGGASRESRRQMPSAADIPESLMGFLAAVVWSSIRSFSFALTATTLVAYGVIVESNVFHSILPADCAGDTVPGWWHRGSGGDAYHCNVAGQLDVRILGDRHLYHDPGIKPGVQAEPFDPEGLVTTLGCFLIAQLRFICGRAQLRAVARGSAQLAESSASADHLREQFSAFKVTRPAIFVWAMVGAVVAVPGLFCAFSLGVPFNKRMWSLSYSLCMSALCCFILVASCLFHELSRVLGAAGRPSVTAGDARLAARASAAANAPGNAPANAPANASASEAAASAGVQPLLDGPAAAQRQELDVEASGASQGLDSALDSGASSPDTAGPLRGSAPALLLRAFDAAILYPFMYLGTNAMLFFVLSDSGGVGCDIVASFTVTAQPGVPNNVVWWWKQTVLMDFLGLRCPAFEEDLVPTLGTNPLAVCGAVVETQGRGCPMMVVYTLLQLAFWIVLCFVLYKRGWFWKI